MTGYDGRGARFDITVVEGNDLSFTVTAVDSDAAAVDPSAATIVGTIYNGAGTSIDTLTAAVSGAGSNVIGLSLTDVEVDALVDAATWALKVTRSGDDRTWLAGRFKVVDADRARNGTSGTAVTATVDTNVTVTTGTDGVDGEGVIAGGTTGQILAKASNADYDTEWIAAGAAPPVDSVNGATGVVVLDADDVGAPSISSGVVAPSTTPTKVGDLYIDTAIPAVYIATGTATAADWTGILTP